MHGHTINPQAARGRPNQALQQPERAGLACAAWSNNCEELAWVDRKADVIKRDLAAVVKADLLEGD